MGKNLKKNKEKIVNKNIIITENDYDDLINSDNDQDANNEE